VESASLTERRLQFAAEDSDHYNCWMKGGNWKTISSERHLPNRNLEVVTDRVQTPARPDPRAWTIVHRKPAVVIAPMTQDGKIILIRQERHPIEQAIWEMPSGQNRRSAWLIEDKIKDTALR
jgi:ADP-ribose pyrophosphatase